MVLSFDPYRDVMMRGIGDLIRTNAIGYMNSATLRSSVVVSTSGFKVRLHLPYYWAYYEHNGRDEIRMPPGRYMIWFPDKRDDPRTMGGSHYPRARTERAQLTKEAFKKFNKLNYQRKKAGLPPKMVVTPFVKASKGQHFYTKAMNEAVASGLVNAIIAATIRSYLESALPRASRRRVVTDL